MTDTPPEGQTVQLSAKGTVKGEPRGDGYCPIADAFWTWGALGGFPPIEDTRLLIAAARRLDTGHLQIERVRAGIASASPEGSIAFREDVQKIVGDAEVALIAIGRALDIAGRLSGRYRIKRPQPAAVLRWGPLIESLRDHYEHIEERALGKKWGKLSPEAEGAWQQAELLIERKFTDGNDAIRLDDEMTELCIAIRDYLLGAWTALVAAANADARAAASGA